MAANIQKKEREREREHSITHRGILPKHKPKPKEHLSLPKPLALTSNWQKIPLNWRKYGEQSNTSRAGKQSAKRRLQETLQNETQVLQLLICKEKQKGAERGN